MSNYLPFKKAPSRIIENDFVIINLYEEDSIIFVGWKRQIVLEERKMSLLQALDLTNHYQVKNWIISDQNIYYLSSEEENWIFSDWVEIASRSSLEKISIVFQENYNMLIQTTDFTTQLQNQYMAYGFINFGHL